MNLDERTVSHFVFLRDVLFSSPTFFIWTRKIPEILLFAPYKTPVKSIDVLVVTRDISGCCGEELFFFSIGSTVKQSRGTFLINTYGSEIGSAR